MDRCAPEILSRIFTFACTDTGATACALRLINHRVSASVEEFRFQSIAVGPESESIYKLAAALDNATPAQLRRMQHLYITLKRDEWDEVVDIPKKYDAHWISIRLRIMGAIAKNERIECAISKIVSHASPRLRTLGLFVLGSLASSAKIALMFQRNFPFLEDLALSLEVSEECCLSINELSRQRLRTLTFFAHGRRVTNIDTSVDIIAAKCPALEEIRIDAVGRLPALDGLSIERDSELRARIETECRKTNPRSALRVSIIPIHSRLGMVNSACKAGSEAYGKIPRACICRPPTCRDYKEEWTRRVEEIVWRQNTA
jgi:hypothetical protein